MTTYDQVLQMHLRSVAGEIATLRGKVSTLEKGLRQAQLAYSSVDTSQGNGNLVVTDGQGNVTGVMGLQGDGTTAFVAANTSVAAVPTPPLATPGPLSLGIQWDGGFSSGVLPVDWDHMEIHLSTTSGFTPSFATIVGTLKKPGYHVVTGLTNGTTYYAALVPVNRSGAQGTPSAQTATTVSATPGLELLYYSTGSPAVGTLVLSVTTAAGTDSVGNQFLAGTTSYINSGGVPQYAAATDGGDTSYYYWGGSSWIIVADVGIAGSPPIFTITALNGAQVSGNLQVIGGVYEVTSWTNVTSFSTGFSGSNVQYALLAWGVNGLLSVAFRGELILTGTTAADSSMFTIPYTFSRNHDYVTPNNLSGYAAGNRVVRVASSGAVRCEPAGSNTNFVILDGVIAPVS
jgi:hypothetical protein